MPQFNTGFTRRTRGKGPHNCQSVVNSPLLTKKFRNLKWLHIPKSSHAMVWDHKYLFYVLTLDISNKRLFQPYQSGLHRCSIILIIMLCQETQNRFQTNPDIQDI